MSSTVKWGTTGAMSKSHQNRVRTKKRRSILEDDFRNGLEAIIGPVSQHVLSFGPLAKNSEWYLVLADQPSKDSLLLAQNVLMMKQGKKFLFRVRSADKVQFTVKVHWAPPFVPNIVLTDLLSNYGTVCGKGV